MKTPEQIKRQILQRVTEVARLQQKGHVDIKTTDGYCHDDAMSVPSPLDKLPANVLAFEGRSRIGHRVESSEHASNYSLPSTTYPLPRRTA